MKSLSSAFDLAAPEYIQHADIQRYSAKALSAWLPGIGTKKVLEVGAGPGVFTEYLLPWKDTLLVTDLSHQMCKVGKIKYPHLTWKSMDATSPVSGPWDLICSSSMLQWSEDPKALFLKWKKVMASKGRILGSLYIEGSIKEWGDVSKIKAPFKWRTDRDFRHCFLSAGFKCIRDEVETKQLLYPSAIAALKSIHHLGASPKPSVGAGKLRRLMKEYERRSGSSLGVPLTWVIYRFEASLD